MKIFHKDKDKFNFCNYPKNLKFYDETNKLVIYKMEDEALGFPIIEFYEEAWELKNNF